MNEIKVIGLVREIESKGSELHGKENSSDYLEKIGVVHELMFDVFEEVNGVKWLMMLEVEKLMIDSIGHETMNDLKKFDVGSFKDLIDEIIQTNQKLVDLINKFEDEIDMPTAYKRIKHDLKKRGSL